MKKRLLLIILGIPLGACLILMVINIYSLRKIQYQNIARHGEDISILVDFGESSANRRFIVYDNSSGEVISTSKCTHGCGAGSKWNKPVFSNKPGSMCSSLGEYRLKNVSHLYNCGLICIRLAGLSVSNSNATSRGITIHEAPIMADGITVGIPIPLSPVISQGCFGISTKTFNRLCNKLGKGKTIYLYAIAS